MLVLLPFLLLFHHSFSLDRMELMHLIARRVLVSKKIYMVLRIHSSKIDLIKPLSQMEHWFVVNLKQTYCYNFRDLTRQNFRYRQLSLTPYRINLAQFFLFIIFLLFFQHNALRPSIIDRVPHQLCMAFDLNRNFDKLHTTLLARNFTIMANIYHSLSLCMPLIR